MKKKSQALNATIIVIVLMIFFILYITFLPPEMKYEIFTNSTNLEEDEFIKENGSVIILHERVGRILPEPQESYEHSISSFSLYHLKNYKTLHDVENLYLYANIFDHNSEKIELNINLETLDSNILVSPQVIDGNSELKFYLNGKLIYVGNSDFVIPKDKVKSKNVLEVKVVNSRLNIFKTNYVKLNLKIYARVKDFTNAYVSIPLFLDSQEKTYCDFSKLTFFLDCIDNIENRLNIKINGYEIYNASPNCRRLYEITIDCSKLNHGENKLEFYALSGSFFFTNMNFKILTKQNISNPIYFDIPDEVYKEIENYVINLSLKFVEEKNTDVILNINGYEREIDAKDYEINIKPLIRHKNNYIIIKSTDIVDIYELMIKATKR